MKTREQQRRHRAKAFLMVACLLAASLCPAQAESFDWRDVQGQDYTTPVRNQGSCGSCWAFAAVGALEAKLEITAGRPGWNPDMSEQHLICDGSCGACSGGWEFRAITFFRDTGIVTEEELPYRGSNTSPDWPLQPGWEDRVGWITDYQNWLPCTTDGIKRALEDYGPLVAAMNTYEDWYWPMAKPLGTQDHYPGAVMEELEGVNHGVAVVGYQDDDSIAQGGYWIVKNSWGTGWGSNGYGYILYGDLERHSRVHAITGDAYMPEPAALSLLAVGWLGTLRRRRRGQRGLAAQVSGPMASRTGKDKAHESH